ncbi:hypothetical protein WMF01_30875 [Sorangium sp. So ce1667]
MAQHVNNSGDLAAEVKWHVHEAPRQGAYVRVTMRNRHTGEFLSEAHEEVSCPWDRPSVLEAERKASDFAARVALGLTYGPA